MRLSLLISFVVVIVFFSASTAYSANFYVSPRGNDKAPGTKTRPFQTLAGACRKVPAGPNTIRLVAGMYEETEPCLIPSGVSVVGAGMGKTILHGSMTEDMERDGNLISPKKFMIQVWNSARATFSDFSMDGSLPDGQRAQGGLLADQVRDVRIHDVAARSFQFGGVYLSEAVNSSVDHCRIDDCGHPHKDSCTGGIDIGDLTNCSVHDCAIREIRGAYGIKGIRLSWGWPKKMPFGEVVSAKGTMKVVRSKFYNNDVHVRQVGGWGEGQPNMSMELWNSDLTDCEICNNRFNECLSLPGHSEAAQTVRVHHNQFILEPGYSYAIEASMNNMEIDHNYFTNGYYPIASFGGRVDGLRIHHNIFDGIEGIQLLFFENGVERFRFVNNTVYLKATFPVFVQQRGVSEDVLFANNLFYKEGAPHAPAFIVLKETKNKSGDTASIRTGTLEVTHNAFFNWAAEGTDAVTAAPHLTHSGSRADGEFFGLLPDSPLRRRGLSVPGITTAARPDIGAGEIRDVGIRGGEQPALAMPAAR